MIREAIARLIDKNNLTMTEAEEVMNEIMRGEATPAQISAFITALRMKGETTDEIAGCAKAMRANAIPVRSKREALVDTCGTGGDGTQTFNISTTVAFVVAGAGVAVAKHGNYSVSSRCGSADLLEALGVDIKLSPEQIGRCLDEIGIGFLFAPALHPAMKHALGPRREIGIRTIFNVLGPLTNPASAKRQLLGVYSASLTETLAEVLGNLGTDYAFVVHGADGLDELSTTGVNQVSQVCECKVETFHLNPQELGLPKAALADLAGGTPEENILLTRKVLQGERSPKRDVVLLNTAAALVALGRAEDFREGMKLAAESIDEGYALRKLEQLVEMSQSLGREGKP